VAFIINTKMEGAVNVASPKPVHNRDFMKVLRQAVNAPFGINTPTLLLKFGAAIIGTEPELVLKSRNVIPARLTQNGFTFAHGNVNEALQDLTTH